MRKSSVALLCVACLLALGGCKGRNRDKTVTLSGAFALYPLAVKWADEFKTHHHGVTIDISAGGAGKGMTDMLANMCDIAMVSREVYPQEEARGAVAFPVAKDAVVAIVNAENPLIAQIAARGMARNMARKVWIEGSVKTWGRFLGNDDNSALRVYTRSDACGAAETWADWLGGTQEDLMGVKVFGDPGIVAAVQNDKQAIGFANLAYAYDLASKLPNQNIVVLPIDINENGRIEEAENNCDTKDRIVAAIEEGAYPSPPARDLYFVTHGIPQGKAVVEFMKYVMTTGQQENVPAGYVGISHEALAAALDRLEAKADEK